MNQNFIFWTPGLSLEELEKQVILRAFQYYRGNKTSTAASLKISIRTLDSRLELYAEQTKKEEERKEAERIKRAEFDRRQRGNPSPYPLGVPYEPYQPTNVRDENEKREETSSLRTETRIPMESSPQHSKEQAMPVPERKEVQSVLPKHTSQGHKGRGR